MTSAVRTSDARWSVALLGAAVVAAVAMVMPWVRGRGTVVPDSSDLTAADVERPGVAVEMSGQGVDGTAGSVLLALACALVVIALWRANPQYRPVWAGYLTIVVAAVAAATAFWFVGDDDLWSGTFGPGVDVQSDSVVLTVWPWIALVCFAVAVVVGVLVVPRRVRGRDVSARDREPSGHSG
ncbi:hypothetical protein [Rhodococcus gannanensis]|uniref:Uncharacterized protein n=1 Tax=Rhodococcus gannanensis TaxID=1960308 RepID=A0ABW4PDC7_9NOCA